MTTNGHKEKQLAGSSHQKIQKVLRKEADEIVVTALELAVGQRRKGGKERASVSQMR